MDRRNTLQVEGMALAVSFLKYQKSDVEKSPKFILGQKYLGQLYNVRELLLKINKLESAIAWATTW